MNIEILTSLHEGEHNASVVLLEVEESLRDKNIRLAFETPSGTDYLSEAITLDANGKGTYSIVSTLLNEPGTLKIQAQAYDGDTFMAKSDVCRVTVTRSIDEGAAVDDDGLITLAGISDRVDALEEKQLPKVTSEDNNKVLMVVDGEWAAEELDDYDEEAV